MKAPKLKIENNTLIVDGDFDIRLSEYSVMSQDEDKRPLKEISFYYSPEVSNEQLAFGEDNVLELLGEKLKQDFIKKGKAKLK